MMKGFFSSFSSMDGSAEQPVMISYMGRKISSGELFPDGHQNHLLMPNVSRPLHHSNTGTAVAVTTGKLSTQRERGNIPRRQSMHSGTASPLSFKNHELLLTSSNNTTSNNNNANRRHHHRSNNNNTNNLDGSDPRRQRSKRLPKRVKSMDHDYTNRKFVTYSKAHELSVLNEDIQAIVEDDQQFAKLQESMKARGAVTNIMLHEGLCLFVNRKRQEEVKKLKRMKKRNDAAIVGMIQQHHHQQQR